LAVRLQPAEKQALWKCEAEEQAKGSTANVKPIRPSARQNSRAGSRLRSVLLLRPPPTHVKTAVIRNWSFSAKRTGKCQPKKPSPLPSRLDSVAQTTLWRIALPRPKQAFYLAVTVLVAIASGLIAGSIANCTPGPKELFSDNDSFSQEYEDLEVPAWHKLTASKTDSRR